jgi:predicted transcriptional regulator
MTRTFTFKYDPKATIKEAFHQMIRAAKSGKPHIEKNQIRSPSLKALLEITTENRLKMFELIRSGAASSVYELAKVFKRDLSYVSKEVRVLESLGLIELKKESVGGRERMRPIARYDRIVLDFDLAQDKVS